MESLEIKKTLINRIKNLRKAYSDNLEIVKDKFDDEAIHDLRVSIRRILAFMFFVDELCNQKLNPSLLTNLKAKIKKFNKLRDIQVQLQFAINHIKKFPELVDFLFFLKKKETKQIKKLKSIIKETNFDLSGDIFFYQKNLQTLECLNNTTIEKIVNVAYSTFKELKDSLSNIVMKDYTTYHKTRLKVKKFRYIIETVEQIIQSPKENLKQIQELQTILGEIQDFTVLISLIEKYCQSKNINLSSFLNFVEFIKQKREEKENEFWDKIHYLEYWDNFLMNF